jgi:hypothetical protein
MARLEQSCSSRLRFKTMIDDDTFLATVTLSGREWRAVLELSNAYGDFEPLAMRRGIGPIALERLIEMGLVEKGRTPDRFDRKSFPVGYRLADRGWKVMKRGRKPI